MKKAPTYLATTLFLLQACNREEPFNTQKIEEVKDIATQNSNDDRAIQKYLETHYFDNQGKIKAFSTTSSGNNNHSKLSDLSPKKLPSGVVVVLREGAQPTQGTDIGKTDIIRLMHTTTAFLSNNKTNPIEIPFISTVNGTGVPQADPSFYYASEKLLSNNKNRNYYEIEGFREGLQYFKSFNQSDSENYNMQGVIIVPSRAAFARDRHYPYNNLNWRNCNFVFNFQVYKTSPRSTK